MSLSVRVSSLSKTYKIHFGPRALLREMLLGGENHHKVRALEDISFTVETGEAFGVVGDNGAGKTTLLKVLTGSAFATSGSAEVEGKVSALLELGLGFHPEFTGRRNIYFSGALMGLSSEEIAEREERIIEFSGLGHFIDKPVRTYSSGMHVRLGFSVATGFEPDVLIIDEALAVGDVQFQKKCTDFILDFRSRGKTILFCSHNLYQVKSLCDRAMWLQKGHAQAIGNAVEVVDLYNNQIREEEPSSDESPWAAPNGMPAGLCQVRSVRLLDDAGQTVSSIRPGESLSIEVEAFFSSEFVGTPGIVIALARNDGVSVYATSSTHDQVPLEELGQGRYRALLVLPELKLLSGSYYLDVCTSDQYNMQVYDIAGKAATFTVTSQDRDRGLIRLDHYWKNQ